MTQQQKIIAAVLGVLIVVSIIIGLSNSKKEATSPMATTTNSYSTSSKLMVNLPETDNQEITIIDNQGEYIVSANATVKGKVEVGDISVDRENEKIKVIYQMPGLSSNYTWPVVYKDEAGSLKQNSILLLGENVTVSMINSENVTDNSYKLNVTYHHDGMPAVSKKFSVLVENGYFRFDSARFE